MVATAEPSTDLRERTQCQGLGEIHRYLARTHHIGCAPRRQKVRAADIVLPRHHPVNVFDFDPLGLLRTDQIAHLALGHFERDWLAGQLAVSQKAVERAFEIAAVVGYAFCDELQHRERNIESGMMLPGGGCPALEERAPQLLAETSECESARKNARRKTRQAESTQRT